MTNVRVFFKLVETGDYVSGGSAGYIAEKTQTIEDLKTNVGSYYDLEELTTAWLLRHNTDNGSILGNSKTVEGCGLKENDVLFIQDPELVRVTFSDLSETKTVWAYRSDTIKSVERAAFSSQTTESSVLLRGVKLDGQSLVHSLVDNISLYREWSPSTPKRILTGLKEGSYRLKNNYGYWLAVAAPYGSLDVHFHSTTGTYFDIKLVSDTTSTIQISYVDSMGIRRYLYPAWSIDEYLICLSTSPVNWTVSEVDTTTFKISYTTSYTLLLLGTSTSKPKLLYTIPSGTYQNWNFVA